MISRKGKTKRVNLIPRRSQSFRLEIPAKVLPLIILVTLGLLAAQGILQQMELKKIRSERDKVAARQQELNQKIDVLMLEKNSAEKKKKQASSIQQIQAKKVSWSDLFKELSLMVSRDIWLSGLQASSKDGKRQVNLEGSAESPLSVSTFFQSLELSFFFRNVMLDSSTRDEKTFPALYRYKFNIPIDEARDQVATSSAAPSASPSTTDAQTPEASP